MAARGILKGEQGYLQKTITVKAPGRGYHLITRDVVAAVPELSKFKVGTMNVFIQHTSASLSLNENADPSVRTDMEVALNLIVPEKWAKDGTLEHVEEGPDDICGKNMATRPWHTIPHPPHPSTHVF